MVSLSAMLQPALTLAYRPFLDPLPGAAQWWWLTIIPLSVLISIAYKAVRIETMSSLSRYGRSVVIMSVQIIALMLGLAAAGHVVIEYIAPALG